MALRAALYPRHCFFHIALSANERRSPRPSREQELALRERKTTVATCSRVWIYYYVQGLRKKGTDSVFVQKTKNMRAQRARTRRRRV